MKDCLRVAWNVGGVQRTLTEVYGNDGQVYVLLQRAPTLKVGLCCLTLTIDEEG